MKTMTCKQLGGACDEKFTANTFEEITELSKAHGMAMFQSGDALHLEAIQRMQSLMMQPEAMQKWLEEKQAAFDALPED